MENASPFPPQLIFVLEIKMKTLFRQTRHAKRTRYIVDREPQTVPFLHDREKLAYFRHGSNHHSGTHYNPARKTISLQKTIHFLFLFFSFTETESL